MYTTGTRGTRRGAVLGGDLTPAGPSSDHMPGEEWTLAAGQGCAPGFVEQMLPNGNWTCISAADFKQVQQGNFDPLVPIGAAPPTAVTFTPAPTTTNPAPPPTVWTPPPNYTPADSTPAPIVKVPDTVPTNTLLVPTDRTPLVTLGPRQAQTLTLPAADAGTSSGFSLGDMRPWLIGAAVLGVVGAVAVFARPSHTRPRQRR